jgi:CBS domain-containing protein
MKAADIMRQPVFATTPGTSVQEVLVQLVTHNVSGMPVVERDGTVIGIVTEDDILGAFIQGVPLGIVMVQGIMSRDPIVVDVETPLAAVIETLYHEGILRVPVVQDGHLVGIISRSDVIAALAHPGHVGDPEFPIFHRHYQGSLDAGWQAPAHEHLIPTYGW